MELDIVHLMFPHFDVPLKTHDEFQTALHTSPLVLNMKNPFHLRHCLQPSLCFSPSALSKADLRGNNPLQPAKRVRIDEVNFGHMLTPLSRTPSLPSYPRWLNMRHFRFANTKSHALHCTLLRLMEQHTNRKNPYSL